MTEQEAMAAILKKDYFVIGITLSEIATIEVATNRKICEEVAGYVREGIRTVDDLRECGCARCLGALKLLGEAV